VVPTDFRDGLKETGRNLCDPTLGQKKGEGWGIDFLVLSKERQIEVRAIPP
jgi:hypothetical protein